MVEESGIYFFSLLSGGPHPEASLSYIRLPYIIEEFSSLHLDLYADLVLVCDSREGSRWGVWGKDIYIHNWKTGDMVAVGSVQILIWSQSL